MTLLCDKVPFFTLFLKKNPCNLVTEQEKYLIKNPRSRGRTSGVKSRENTHSDKLFKDLDIRVPKCQLRGKNENQPKAVHLSQGLFVKQQNSIK